MTTKLTRRSALAGAAAIPAALAPLAYVQAADTTTEPDPAITAYNEWLRAETAWWRSFETHPDDEDYSNALCRKAWAAKRRLADTVPTTLPGLCCMIRFGVHMNGNALTNDPARVVDPSNYTGTTIWANGLDGRYAQSLLAGADRLIGKTAA